MRKIFWIIILCVLAEMGITQTIDDLNFGTNATFEVITWNLEFFPTQGQTTIHKVTRIIEALDVDVLAIQEVDQLTAYVNSDFLSLAFLYKEDVIEVLNVFEIYTNENAAFPRPPLVMELRYEGQFLAIINNHLKCCGDDFLDQFDPWDEETRRFVACDLLEEYIQQHYPNEPVIVVGDFNDMLTDNTSNNIFRPFLNASNQYRFADIDIANGSTANWSYPWWPSHLDHILVTNELFDVLEAEEAMVQTFRIDDYLIGGWNEYSTSISDHRPVGLKIPISNSPVAVKEDEHSNSLLYIAPNPFSDWTLFSFPTVEENANLQIFNVQGNW